MILKIIENQNHIFVRNTLIRQILTEFQIFGSNITLFIIVFYASVFVLSALRGYFQTTIITYNSCILDDSLLLILRTWLSAFSGHLIQLIVH